MWAWHSIAQDMLSICGRTHTRHTHTHSHTGTGTHILRLWCICFYLFLLAATMCDPERGVLRGGGHNEDVHEIKQFWVAQRMPMMQLHVRVWVHVCVCLRVCEIVHYLPTKPFAFDARALFENPKLKCCLIKTIYTNWYTCMCVCVLFDYKII